MDLLLAQPNVDYPIAWIGATGLLLGVAALANLVPAHRAARVKPWLALKTD